MNINIEMILENNFLIIDCMTVKEYKDMLIKDEQAVGIFAKFFLNPDNVRNIENLLKSQLYKDYCKNKNRSDDFYTMTVKDVWNTFTPFKTLKKFGYDLTIGKNSISNTEKFIEDFKNEITSLNINNILEKHIKKDEQ
ncbi:TPA: hypothetical protein RKT18_001051 [Bacillus cereus]|nr:hypothetical protein [Bacillus cereus]